MNTLRKLRNKPLTGYGLYLVINWIRKSFVSKKESPRGLRCYNGNSYGYNGLIYALGSNYQRTYTYKEVKEKETTIVIETNGVISGEHAVIGVPHSFIINNTSEETVTISFSSYDSSYEITSNEFEITSNSIIEITVMLKDNKKIIVFR